MAITAKERELVAVGISVATGCKPCTNYHVKKARIEGADNVEISDAIAEAIHIRHRATDTIKAHALGRVYIATRNNITENIGKSTRINELLAIGTAFAVNCVTTLRQHLEVAKNNGITPGEIRDIIKLGMFIKKKAAMHAEKVFAISKEATSEHEAA